MKYPSGVELLKKIVTTPTYVRDVRDIKSLAAFIKLTDANIDLNETDRANIREARRIAIIRIAEAALEEVD